MNGKSFIDYIYKEKHIVIDGNKIDDLFEELFGHSFKYIRQSEWMGDTEFKIVDGYSDGLRGKQIAVNVMI